MPYCPGAATDYIGNIDEATLWHFLRDVAAGLEYLHNAEIVHHDIKPDNVLIDTEGNFLITDFGISKKMRSTLRRNSMRQMEENATGGSISYMGPEMFGPHPESVKATDIWALGATLYEMCEGELPFFGQGGGMQLNGAAIPDLRGNYSDDIKQIVQMCLAKDPWDRPMASQLREYAQAKMDGQTLTDFGGSGYTSGGSGYTSGGGGYPSGGGQVYQSGNGGLGPDEPVGKKKSKVGLWSGGIAAVVVIAIVLVIMIKPHESPELIQARENIPTYLKKVDSCKKHINEGKYGDYKPLLTARTELKEVKQLEEQGKEYLPETYKEYTNLNRQLESKCDAVSRKYEEFAIKSMGTDNDQALEYFEYAKEVMPSFNSEEYQNLKKIMHK